MDVAPRAEELGLAWLRRSARDALGLNGEDQEPLTDAELRALVAPLQAIRARVLSGASAGHGRERYLDAADARAAYALGLAPRTLLAVLTTLRDCPLPGAASVLDLGCGGGAASLAAVLLGARSVSLVDASAGALRAASSLLRSAGASTVQTRHAVLGPDTPAWAPADARFDLMVAAFSLSEVCGTDTHTATAWLASLAPHAAPHGRLLLVDSAEPDHARALQRLREPLLAQGWHLWAPCPHSGPCPALLRPRDFCHAVWRGSPPADVERLGQLSGVHRQRLAFSYLLCGRDPPPAAPPAVRVIGDPQVEKGRVRVAVCHGGGVREVWALARKPDAAAAVSALTRGDRLAFNPPADAGPALRLDTVPWAQG